MLSTRSLLSVSVLAAATAFTSVAFAQADASLPNPPIFPDENPLIPDQDLLGKFLFWEEQMGGDNTMACGTCHIHEAGGSDPRSLGPATHPGADGIFGNDDDVNGSFGVVRFDQMTGDLVHEDTFFPGVQSTGRKSPTTINAAHFSNVGMFWDGRATEEFVDPQTGLVAIQFGGALEAQAVGPPGSDVEMAGLGQTWDNIVAKLATVKPMALATNLPTDMADFLTTFQSYPAMFAHVYGDDAITSKRVAFAIANYERTLISDETPLDDDLKGIQVLPQNLQDGLDLFNGDANCAACHTLPFTSDLTFHNIGLRPDDEDIGLEAVTASFADKAKFKTPNIRNSKLRVPLFHNGSKDSVAEVIDFYDLGGDFNDNGLLDENMQVLNLTQQQKDLLIDLVEIGMTDARVENGLHPFTRPTLRSEMPPLNTTYGVESDNGVGVFPKVIANRPANLGNSEFLLGVDDATASQLAAVAFAFDPDPAGTIFADPRFPLPVNLDLRSVFLIIDTVTDANGVASVTLPIPPNPILTGMTIYAQWIINDPAATDTGGLYGSLGIEIPLL